jgi:hypothetical protein
MKSKRRELVAVALLGILKKLFIYEIRQMRQTRLSSFPGILGEKKKELKKMKNTKY